MATGRKSIPWRVRKAVLERCDWRCVECGTHRNPQIDHIVPVSEGGEDAESNLQVLCWSCNMAKGPRPNPLRVQPRQPRWVPGEPRILIAVRLAPNGLAAVEDYAKERHLTRSAAIRALLGKGLAVSADMDKNR